MLDYSTSLESSRCRTHDETFPNISSQFLGTFARGQSDRPKSYSHFSQSPVTCLPLYPTSGAIERVCKTSAVRLFGNSIHLYDNFRKSDCRGPAHSFFFFFRLNILCKLFFFFPLYLGLTIRSIDLRLSYTMNSRTF